MIKSVWCSRCLHKSLTMLTWFKASARSFWLIPQRLATLVWHLWWTFILHSEQKIGFIYTKTNKNNNFHFHKMHWIIIPTFTLEALFDHSPQQTPAVVAEGWAHVVMCLKAMWHVNLKALLLKLWMHKKSPQLKQIQMLQSQNNHLYCSIWMSLSFIYCLEKLKQPVNKLSDHHTLYVFERSTLCFHVLGILMITVRLLSSLLVLEADGPPLLNWN